MTYNGSGIPFFIVFLNGLLVCLAGTAAPVVRVDVDNVSGTENGATWATAFSSIQAGIDAVTATGQPGELWVAGGAYRGTGTVVVTMAPHCDLYGGFAGTENARVERDIQAHASIIDGENQRTCVFGADNARLDGFTVTRGNGPPRPAMLAEVGALISGFGSYTEFGHLFAMDNAGVSPTIADCVFTGNSSGCAVIFNFAVLNAPCSVSITRCAVSNNPGFSYGVLNGSSNNGVCSPEMSNCSFANNSIGVMNAGIFGTCMPVMRRCVFSANAQMGMSTASPYGAYCRPRLENCLFTGHPSYTLFVGSNVDLVNCTIADNSSPMDAFMISSGFAAGTVKNCVVWNNTGGFTPATPTLAVSYCDVEGGYAGTGNINVNPRFVDAAGGNFQLQSGSPCVDAGTAGGAPATDLLGVSRPKGMGYDMGAYEMAVMVVVPDLVGVDQVDVSAAVTAVSLKVGAATLQCSDMIPKGFVTGQFPAAGTQAVAGSAVAFVVSTGPCPRVPVAGVGGLMLLAAVLGAAVARKPQRQ